MRLMILKYVILIGAGGVVGGLFGYVRSCVDGG
jgi:hypothetical protein